MALQPVALGLSLCDYVILEERTKKVSLIGTFTGLSADRFPALVLPFSVYAVLTDAVGDVTMDLVVSRLDSGEELYTYRGVLHFAEKLAEVAFHVRLREFRFPAPGQYQFTLLADGEWVAQRRLRVRLREV